MAKTVVGLYDDHRVANDVIETLDDQGFDRSNIHVESHRSEQSAHAFGDDLAAELTSRGVPREDTHFYAEGVRRGGTFILLDVPDDQVDTVTDVMNEYRPVQVQQRREAWQEQGYTGYDPDAERYSEEETRAERERYSSDDEEDTISIVEEEVRIGKRSVERGGVRIHSHVREEDVEEQVTLRDEEIDVERREVNRELSAEEAEDAFQERDIEMTETDEEAVVDKKARVTGEVTARKRSQDRTETVHETARKTQVDVEDESDSGRHADDFRSHYDETYGASGDEYSTYEPAYRHGHAYGSDDRYAGRDYSDVEPEMRSSYEQRHGKGTWQKVKDAARHAFNR